jgi:hypothetical protein
VKALALLVALLSVVVSASVPKPPVVCVDFPEVDSYFCPLSDTRFVFTIREECEEPKLWFQACGDPPPENPDNFAPTPPVDPGYDEHDPVGPTDDGAPGAPTVDKPAP